MEHKQLVVIYLLGGVVTEPYGAARRPPPSFNSTLVLTDPANSGKVIPVAFGEEGK